MYDMHYDLLSILYSTFIHGTKERIASVLNILQGVYSHNNINGGLINLYFMPPKEMEEELGILPAELEDVPTMLKKSISLLCEVSNIIPTNKDFLYSIEGCTYLKDGDLEKLYQLGVRSILPVWNDRNRFGSGIRSNYGLTESGINLIKKGIDLGMIIDISHANSKTFDGIIELVREEQALGHKVHLIASHSNCRSLCDRGRNLTDEQLCKLKEVGGFIGLFSNAAFVSNNYLQETHTERQFYFQKHIQHVMDLGFDDEHILLSTDDMNFMDDPSYQNRESFHLTDLALETKNLLQKYYNVETVDKLMFKNAQHLFEQVRSYYESHYVEAAMGHPDSRRI